METYPRKIFYNGYGPTETTGVSLCYRIENFPSSSDEKIPIGVPRKETRTYVFREDNSLAEVGEVGELCISGKGLSPGYLNDIHKTNTHFIKNPLDEKEIIYKTGDLVIYTKDGYYEYVGRKDEQIKWMGYRIELGEIEHSINSIEGIIDAAVILCDISADHTKALCAYYASDRCLDNGYITTELSKKLPPYMIPKMQFQEMIGEKSIGGN
jgi:acyl-coenzyme A synthetase/AMP-(fatty) acid ligase